MQYPLQFLKHKIKDIRRMLDYHQVLGFSVRTLPVSVCVRVKRKHWNVASLNLIYSKRNCSTWKKYKQTKNNNTSLHKSPTLRNFEIEPHLHIPLISKLPDFVSLFSWLEAELREEVICNTMETTDWKKSITFSSFSR